MGKKPGFSCSCGFGPFGKKPGFSTMGKKPGFYSQLRIRPVREKAGFLDHGKETRLFLQLRIRPVREKAGFFDQTWLFLAVAESARFRHKEMSFALMIARIIPPMISPTTAPMIRIATGSNMIRKRFIRFRPLSV